MVFTFIKAYGLITAEYPRSDFQSSTSTQGVSRVKNNSAGKQHPVALVLSELIDINKIKENVVAKGVPYNTLSALVEISAVGKEAEISNLKNSALQAALSQYGVGAIKRDELDAVITNLLELEDDLEQVRKLSRSQDLNPQAINVLTNVVRQNPGDRGASVLNLILEYAEASGIKLKITQSLPTEEEMGPPSVIPDIPRESKELSGWKKHRKLGIEITLGAIVAWCAMALLN